MENTLKEYLQDTVAALKSHGEEKNSSDNLNKALQTIIQGFEKEILDSGVYIDLKIKVESKQKDSQNHPLYFLTWESKVIRTHVQLHKKIDQNGFNYQRQRSPTVEELLLVIEHLPELSERIKQAYEESTRKLKEQREADVRLIAERVIDLPEELKAYSKAQISKFLN